MEGSILGRILCTLGSDLQSEFQSLALHAIYHMFHTRFSGNFIFSFHKKPAQTCFCLMVLIGTNKQQKGGSM